MHCVQYLFTFFVPLFLSVGQSFGRITGISAPQVILHPGDQFNVTFATQDFIQNNVQYYALFGISEGKGFPQALGALLGTGVDLVANGNSNTPSGGYNVTLQIPSPYAIPSGGGDSYLLMTAILGTIGASEMVTLQYFNTTIQISVQQ